VNSDDREAGKSDGSNLLVQLSSDAPILVSLIEQFDRRKLPLD